MTTMPPSLRPRDASRRRRRVLLPCSFWGGLALVATATTTTTTAFGFAVVHPPAASPLKTKTQPSQWGQPLRRAAETTKTAATNDPQEEATTKDVAVILLAGGVGSRMKADRPKQFLDLQGKPVLAHSLELFLSLKGVSRVVLVLDESFRDEFKTYDVAFADPGAERQDSVKNGFEQCPPDAALVCIHDAARPLVTPDAIYRVIADAREHGAAVLGVPVKPTIKETDDGSFVARTLERKRLWEVQTPQVIRPDLLAEGFARVEAENLEVTDDVSIVEHLGKPVKLTLGDYTNLKLTTPDDMIYASAILDLRGAT